MDFLKKSLLARAAQGMMMSGGAKLSLEISDPNPAIGQEVTLTATLRNTLLADIAAGALFEADIDGGGFTQIGIDPTDFTWAQAGNDCVGSLTFTVQDPYPPPVTATVKVLNSTIPTSTGTVDYTHADLSGLTPKGVLILADGVPLASALDTDTANIQRAIGVTDGTTSFSVSHAAQDAQATTVADGSLNNTPIHFESIGGGSAAFYADTPVMIDGGIRLTWNGSMPASARNITFVFFAGSDVSCQVNHVDIAETPGDTITTTWQPDGLITVFNRVRLGPTYNSSANASTVLGAADFTNQASSGIYNRDAQATGAPRFGAFNSLKCTFEPGVNGTCDEYMTASQEADGYTIIQENTGRGSNTECLGVLAIKGLSVAVGTLQSPTTPQTVAVTGLGFQPVAYVLGGTRNDDTFPAADGAHQGGHEGSSFGASDGTTHAAYAVMSDLTASAPQKSRVSQTNVIYAYDLGGPDGVIANHDSMDAGGFTLDFTGAGAGSATMQWYIAFG